LIATDQPPQAVFVLDSGRAKLSTAAREGKQIMLRIAESGEVLGLSSVISGNAYDITAKTLSPSVVRVLRRQDFLGFIEKFNETNRFILDALTRDYETALDCLRSLAWFSTATARLAHLLLQISGEADKMNAKAKLALTQEQMAQMTATTRETVTRLLLQLRRDRIISIRGSHLLVRDRAALERLAS
jgi:CRP/FNR family transcriptional regulator